MIDPARTQEIHTPEGIVFAMRIAGPIRRLLAMIVDQAAILAASQVLGALLGLLGVLHMDMYAAASMLGYFLLSFGYPVALEWTWNGQTLGKRLLRLRVMDEEGLNLEFNQVLVRNMFRIVDAFPAFYLVGGVAAGWSARGQRLGDLAAHTLVVHHPRIREPDLALLDAHAFNSFRAYPHRIARLRDAVSPEGAGLAMDALLRRNRLSPDARLAVFRGLADHFRSLVAFPPESTEGLSDEAYVRNITDLLFNAH